MENGLKRFNAQYAEGVEGRKFSLQCKLNKILKKRNIQTFF